MINIIYSSVNMKGELTMILAVLIDALILLSGIPFFLDWYHRGFITAAKQDDWIFIAPLFLIVLPIFFIAKEREEKRRLRLMLETAAFIGGKNSLPRVK